MKLKLTRPLAFFDLEATGTNRENDRIVEIAICTILPLGGRQTVSYLINPEMPIPAESTAIHGISDTDVADKPTFNELAPALFDILKDCDVAGFNSNNFDVPMLFNHFLRAGLYWDYSQFKMVDAGNLYKIKEPRTLSAAYQFYCGEELENAHSAKADIWATVDVFEAQLEMYNDLPDNVDELALLTNHGKKILDLSGKFGYNEKGEVIFNFGQHKGKLASENLDYVSWMYSRDFPQDTMKVCAELLGFINQPS